jgi:hypothetical protein
LQKKQKELLDAKRNFFHNISFIICGGDFSIMVRFTTDETIARVVM